VSWKEVVVRRMRGFVMGIFSLISGFTVGFRQQDFWGGLTRKSAFVLADTPL